MAERDDDMIASGTNRSVEGKTDHLKGHVKDAVGGLTGDNSMQAEGKMDQAKGSLKDTLGKAERKLGGSE